MCIITVTDKTQFETCANIWLEASLAAHAFIPAQFWRNGHAAMRDEYLPASTVFVAEEEHAITGFAAVRKNVVEALFVRREWWGKEIGSALLRRVRQEYSELELCVYEKNMRAKAFYLKHGFIVTREQRCLHTGEPEIVMHWK